MARDRIPLSDLRTAAYCPRKCYYQRQLPEEEREPPSSVDAIQSLERRYEQLLESSPDSLEDEPIAVAPTQYRETLEATRDRLVAADQWSRLRNPAERSVCVTGRDCRGIVHKVLTEPLEPVVISSGKPPEQGVWESQSVHAVGAAKALGWEHETAIDRVWLEYPAYGEIRSLELTTRRKARYRRTLRTVREIDGPPARTNNRSKCESCEFVGECGVRTRTLRSLLGFS